MNTEQEGAAELYKFWLLYMVYQNHWLGWQSVVACTLWDHWRLVVVQSTFEQVKKHGIRAYDAVVCNRLNNAPPECWKTPKASSLIPTVPRNVLELGLEVSIP